MLHDMVYTASCACAKKHIVLACPAGTLQVVHHTCCAHQNHCTHAIGLCTGWLAHSKKLPIYMHNGNIHACVHTGVWQTTTDCNLQPQNLLGLTEDQVQDLMLMRQLYLTKRGLLVMERKALVDQMASGDGGMPHPSDNITRMADLATCLKENAAEDHHVHRKVARAAFRGVRPATPIS